MKYCLNQDEINEQCNKIKSEGKTPFALVYNSAEMKKRPINGAEIFFDAGDIYPEIREIFDNIDDAKKKLAENGAFYCNPSSSYGNYKFFSCYAYAIFEMIDNDDDGEYWDVDYSTCWDVSPAPAEEEEEED